MSNGLAIISEEDIKNKIYTIRGKEVMLDSDLAKLYHVETKRINEAVKNNQKKFPERYSWILEKNEEILLRSKISTSSLNSNYGGRRYNTRVFTEQGVAMLATILKSETAVEVSIKIIDAFVAMRHIIKNSIDYQRELFIMQNKMLEHDTKFIEYDSKFEDIFNRFDSEDYLKNKLIFENHIYDAYSFLIDLLKQAKDEIIIIDNYCDKEILDLICNIKINVIVISKNMNNELIKKYQSQYNNLTIKYDDSFHDRFIIIDKIKAYHLGSSLKDLGKKCSYISKIDDKENIKFICNICYGEINELLKTIQKNSQIDIVGN